MRIARCAKLTAYTITHYNPSMTTSSLSAADLAAKSLDLPVVPVVAQKVMDEMTRVSCSAESLSAIIRGDQALMGRILRIANSAFYRRPIPAKTLEQAVVRLGLGLVRDLAISLSTQSLFKRFGPLETQMWEHSIAVGTAAQLIAKQTGAKDTGEAFVAGMMHDTGKVLLNNHAPELYAKAVARAAQEGRSLYAIEREEFGFDHAVVGGLMLKKWELPDEIVNAAVWHHSSDELDMVPGHSRTIVATVALANDVAHAVGLTVGGVKTKLDAESNAAAITLGFDQEKSDALCAETLELFKENRGVFS